MALPKTGSKLFQNPRNYERTSAYNPRTGLPPTNMQGMPATSTSALAGALMGGFTGAATSGALMGMGRGYGASQQQRDLANTALRNNNLGMQSNPMRATPYDQRREDFRRTQSFLDQNPLAGSSSQAGLAAGRIPVDLQNPMTAGSVNRYDGRVAPDPYHMTPDQKYALAQQSAGRMGESDPTNMRGRFGAGSALGQQAARIAQNDAAGNIALRSYGQNPMYVEKGESPEVQYRSNKNGDQVSYIPGGAGQYSGMTALRNQKADLERGASRRLKRELERDRREGVKFKRAVSQGMNPMSPQAKAMFPNQVAQVNGQNPMGGNTLAGSSLAAGNPRTPTSIQDAGVVMDGLAKGDPNTGTAPDPFMSLLGAGGNEDASVDTIHTGLIQASQNGVNPTPADLRTLKSYLTAMKHRTGSSVTPSAWNQGGNGAPDYEGLVGLDDIADDEELQSWWETNRQKLNPYKPGPSNYPVMPPGAPMGR